ncbi:MAG: winged helix-turn-helix domain-containing protein [Pirellulales bacterium]
MKKNEVKVGQCYAAKVSDRMCTIRIDAENPRGGWDATNLRTNKTVRIKSAQRLRGETRGPQRNAASQGEKARLSKATRDSANLARKIASEKASARAMADSTEDAARAKKSSKASGKAKAGTSADTGERRATKARTGNDAKPKRTSGLDAAVQVLAEADEPLAVKDIVEQMLERGLWQTSGKTPHATIYAAIFREIATKGDDARFRKVERGKFALAE